MAKRKREILESAGAANSLKTRKEHAASSPKQARKATPASKSKENALNGQALAGPDSTASAASKSTEKKELGKEKVIESNSETTTLQIITGSYERVLHGFIATITQNLVTGHDDAPPQDDTSKDSSPKVTFSDTFLFNAHASAIRCLALSPQTQESSKIILATGSTDERINLYSLSTTPPLSLPPPNSSHSKPSLLPTLSTTPTSSNPSNKELGSLLHHSSSLTSLHFPTRSKLLSSSEDSTIAIIRTRDWTPLSTIKSPIPKPQGRPSGDTAAPGEVPAGVSSFAVHPSMKLMLSVGRGEKCMRLWNLVTGKKAGVLGFGREMLGAVEEGRFGSGEGRSVVWDSAGDEFAVGFERGVVVFGIDCKAKAKVVPVPRTKVHRIGYLPLEKRPRVLLVSTEDGRVALYDTNATASYEEDAKEDDIPSSTLIAQIGGPAAGITGRVKDFELVQAPSSTTTTPTFFLITGSSDGTVRLWSFSTEDLKHSADAEKEKGFTAKQVGRLLGTYSTSTRITCLKAFAMTGTPDAVDEEVEAVDVPEEKSSEESSSSEDDDEDE